MDCSTRLCDWDRLTGMPPSHWNKPLKGLLKMASFPSQCIRALRAKAVISVKGKSQFEVCGAPTRTNFGIDGSCPSVRHPARLKMNREVQCKAASSSGVLKIVWFTVAAFSSFQNNAVAWIGVNILYNNHGWYLKQRSSRCSAHPEKNGLKYRSLRPV